jgi:hypothetical protein
VVLSDGSYLGDRTSDQILAWCSERSVPALGVLNRRGEAEQVAAELLDWLHGEQVAARTAGDFEA